MRPRCYVAGPFTAPTDDEIALNVAQADAVGRELFDRGWAPFVPHKGTNGWQHDERNWTLDEYLEADFAFLETCAAMIIYTTDWTHSEGTKREKMFCEQHNPPIPVYVWPACPDLLECRNADQD